jgi:hypothetical protein
VTSQTLGLQQQMQRECFPAFAPTAGASEQII